MQPPVNLNTQQYWDKVYRGECESGIADTDRYSRDYGPIHDAVIALIPDGSTVLDIACGPGLLCRKIRQRLPETHVTGVDFSHYMIEHNRQRDQELGIDYRHLDIRTALPDLPTHYDVVTMCEILEHLEEPEKVVSQAIDRLKTGGRFILTCPHDNEIPDPEHLRLWGHDDLFHLLANYSDTISFSQIPPPYYHPWMLASLTIRR